MKQESVKEQLYGLNKMLHDTQKCVTKSTINQKQKDTILSFADWQLSRDIPVVRVVRHIKTARSVAE